MILPGYDDRGPDDLDGPGLAYDGSALLESPSFWAAHLGPLLEADLDEKLAELFGERLDAIRASYQRLTDPTAWPVFPIELGNGARLAVVYRNFDEDKGIDYLRLPAPGEEWIRIATVEGEPDGPAISWRELTAIADRQPDPLDRARVLLLLAPIVGEAATPAAMARLADALRSVRITGDVGTIAEKLVAAAP